MSTVKKHEGTYLHIRKDILLGIGSMLLCVFLITLTAWSTVIMNAENISPYVITWSVISGLITASLPIIGVLLYCEDED